MMSIAEPPSPLTLPLQACDRTHIADCGSKAANLGECARAGFPVPEGFVVTVHAFQRFLEAHRLMGDAPREVVEAAPMDEEVVHGVRRALAHLEDGPLAVRSSGVEEDLPDASFAGQYETVLDVRGEDALLRAIRHCWASAFAPRVVAYRKARGLVAPPRIAVLVQRLVRPEAAGVAFTANPVTGDRGEVVISSVRGLGERLVSGEASADEWVVRDGRAECRRSYEGSIGALEVLSIAELARRVEAHYGSPQDIEWARAADRLYLIQARPITALPEAVAWEAPAPGAWLRNFRLGEWLDGPMTPLFETWLVERLDNRFFADLKRALRMPTPEPHHVVVHGWYFASVNFLPRTRLQMVGLGIRYFLPGFLLRPRKMAMLTTRFAHWGIGWFEREWRETIRPAYLAAVARADAEIPAATPERLLEIVDGLVDAAGRSFYSLAAVAGSAWKPELVLAAFYRKELAPRIGGGHQQLLQGLGVPVYRGSGTLSLDWVHPTLDETGGAQDPVRERTRKDAVQAERRRLEAAARAALEGEPRKLRRFERLLAHAQEAARAREEQTAEFTRAWPAMRRALHRLGAGLVEGRVLASPEDVFFLRREELAVLVDGRPEAPGLGNRIAERRSEWQRRRRLVPPLQLGVLPPLARRLLGGFEETLGARASSGEGIVTGMPASPGVAAGRVRVIRTVEEFDRLQDGEVLVTQATNPAWTPLFARAAAVVTDTGSLMAHASLVAREYGIPAVVGTGDATARLRDGDLVTVDGSRGTVSRVARGSR